MTPSVASPPELAISMPEEGDGLTRTRNRSADAARGGRLAEAEGNALEADADRRMIGIITRSLRGPGRRIVSDGGAPVHPATLQVGKCWFAHRAAVAEILSELCMQVSDTLDLRPKKMYNFRT